MNQKIREMARNAGLIAPYGSDREGLRDFDYKEFAQLLVARCAQICQDNALYSGGTLAGMILQEFENDE